MTYLRYQVVNDMFGVLAIFAMKGDAETWRDEYNKLAVSTVDKARVVEGEE